MAENVCPQCGAPVDPGATECRFCGEKFAIQQMNQQLKQASEPQAQPQIIIQNDNSRKTVSERKEYNFRSGSGLNWITFGTGRITTNVVVDNDRMKIEMTPSRFNKVPVILLDDILNVEVKFKFAVYWIIYSIICLIVCLANPLFLILLALFIFAGINRKIIIHQRNGIDVCIYAKDKQLAQTFQSEINSII